MKRNLFFILLAAASLGAAFFLAGCAKPKTGASGGQTVAYWADPMNPTHTYDKPGKAPCGMDLVPVYATDANLKGIRIDPAVVQNTGVTTEVVQERTLQREIRTSGTLAPNERKVYNVNSKIMGWADRLYVNYTGESVTRGQALLDLYAPELVSTQEEYLQSLRYARSLPADASEDSRRGAQDLVASARARLLNWDVTEAEIDALERRGAASKTLPLRSPDNGVVLEKMIEQGKQVEPGMPLYRIADLSVVWVMADLYQQDLPFVAVGNRAGIELSDWPGKAFAGRVAFISPVVNPDSKTAQARIEVTNTPDLTLKPGMFATVRILSPVPVKAVAVPEQAVIHSGERHVIVMALGNGYFEPREVALGVSAGGYTQVLTGLTAGEKVVTSAQFLIDSESNLKNAIDQMAPMPGMAMPQGNSAPVTPSRGRGGAAAPSGKAPAPQPSPVRDNMQNMPGM
jgi:RND family efflux transporter MFP subunit